MPGSSLSRLRIARLRLRVDQVEGRCPHGKRGQPPLLIPDQLTCCARSRSRAHHQVVAAIWVSAWRVCWQVCAFVRPLFRVRPPGWTKKGFCFKGIGRRQPSRQDAVQYGGPAGDGLSSRALSDEVPLRLRWGPRRRQRETLAGEPDAGKIAADRGGIGQRGSQVQTAATGGTDGHIQGKDPRQQHRPGQPMGMGKGNGCRRLDGRGRHRRVGHVLTPVAGIRRQDAVIPDQIEPAQWDEGGWFFTQLQRRQQQMCRPIRIRGLRRKVSWSGSINCSRPAASGGRIT